jgi:hypothetical protein
MTSVLASPSSLKTRLLVPFVSSSLLLSHYQGQISALNANFTPTSHNNNNIPITSFQ